MFGVPDRIIVGFMWKKNFVLKNKAIIRPSFFFLHQIDECAGVPEENTPLWKMLSIKEFPDPEQIRSPSSEVITIFF